MIKEIKNIVPTNICNKIINTFDNIKLINQQVYKDGENLDSKDRIVKGCHTSEIEYPILKPIVNYISKITNLPISHQEDLNILKYSPGGKYDLHYDCIHPDESEKDENPRLYSIILYLNDNFTGGRTIFPKIEKNINPEQGKLLIWENIDSYGNFIQDAFHAGEPVKSGIKWVLVCWVRKYPIKNEYRESFNLDHNINNNLEYFTIKNSLNQKEQDLFWNTFNYLKPFLSSPEETGSAKDSEGNLLKNNKALFFDQIKPRPIIENWLINKLHNTVFSNPKLNQYLYNAFSNSILNNSFLFNSLISYYNKNNSEYKTHVDTGKFTLLLWFSNSKNNIKNFEGGDLVFPDYDIFIPFKHNTGVIFPSWIKHKVTPLQMLDENLDNGKITYTLFLN